MKVLCQNKADPFSGNTDIPANGHTVAPPREKNIIFNLTFYILNISPLYRVSKYSIVNRKALTLTFDHLSCEEEQILTLHHKCLKIFPQFSELKLAN